VLVFVTAAVGKLADQDGTRTTLDEFGVPSRFARSCALLLPLAELATALALVIQPTARWGAVAALLLLAMFAAGILHAMANGRAPDCNCFGQISSAPAGPRTLVRNAVIALPALFVAVYGPGEALSAGSGASAAVPIAVGLGLVAVALGALCFRLWHDNKRLQGDLDRARDGLAAFPPGLPVGSSAPRFALPDLEGNMVTLDSLLALGKPVALAFVSPNCGPCAAMLQDIARWQASLADRLTIALPAGGTVSQVRALTDEFDFMHVLADEERHVFESYRCLGTPSAVLITPEGRIGSDNMATHAIMETLIRRVLTGDVAEIDRVADASTQRRLDVIFTPGSDAVPETPTLN
jgi:uncharacterized membrane protein YphA (DoxX/SURF4 family)/peroxiredoxin